MTSLKLIMAMTAMFALGACAMKDKMHGDMHDMSGGEAAMESEMAADDAAMASDMMSAEAEADDTAMAEESDSMMSESASDASSRAEMLAMVCPGGEVTSAPSAEGGVLDFCTMPGGMSTLIGGGQVIQ